MSVLIICKACNGEGTVQRKFLFPFKSKCLTCKGTGKVDVARPVKYKNNKRKDS
jgi:DnaJ-class molecular chaperone